MSFQRPRPEAGNVPFAAIAKGMSFWDQLERDGFTAGTPEFEEAMLGYLNSPGEDHCRCGRPLKLFEIGGKKCQQCVQADDEKEERDPTREERMAKMGVPASYRHCTLDSWRGPTPDGLLSWISRPTPSLVLFGASPGAGKTHLATAALYAMNSGGRRTFWASAIYLVKRLSQEVFSDDHPTEHKSTRVEVLLVDDYGKEEGVVPNAKPMLAALIDERLAHSRPTIVTTNLTPERLCLYDIRLASRLLATDPIEREGEDQRWASEEPGELPEDFEFP